MEFVTPTTIAVLLIGALTGGFVAGLTGFGTALVVSALWLQFWDPLFVAPLVAICSVAGQLSGARTTWRMFQWRAVTPFLIGAAFGLPIGSWLLDHVSAEGVKIATGLFLTFYAGYFLLGRTLPKVAIENRAADGGVGVVGGVMGGMVGLSGPAPIIWCQLRQLSKQMQRGIYQPYNTIVLGAAVALHALAGRVDASVGIGFLICLPATILGATIGERLYHALDDRVFHRAVLALLLLAGLGLLIRTVLES